MRSLRLALALAMACSVWQIPAVGQGTSANRAQLSQRDQERIVKEVHHELVLLPYYGVFDNLAY